jgi:hypothetical protein
MPPRPLTTKKPHLSPDAAFEDEPENHRLRKGLFSLLLFADGAEGELGMDVLGVFGGEVTDSSSDPFGAAPGNMRGGMMRKSAMPMAAMAAPADSYSDSAARVELWKMEIWLLWGQLRLLRQKQQVAKNPAPSP